MSIDVTSYDQLYIDGRWVSPSGTERIEVTSPWTEQVIGSTPAASRQDIDRAVAAARRAFDEGPWGRTTPEERIEAIGRFTEAYRRRVDEIAATITAEMGSTITFSNQVQGNGPLSVLEVFLDVARDHEWMDFRKGSTADVYVRSEAVGVVAAIAPWNTPQNNIMSKLAPALVAGCTVVVKPAPETPIDALLMAEIIDEAGFPPGVINVVPCGNAEAEYLVGHPDVDKVAFTGSTAVGRRIGAICGEQVKRCSLELGGKSAAIVLDDADVAATVSGLKFASFMLNGESCVAQTRVLVSERRRSEVVEALAELVAAMPVGDPFDPVSEVGPLVSRRQKQRVDDYIGIGVAEGARAVVGGQGMPDGLDHGWFVRPTLFDNVTNDMRIAREEIFGPVLSVITYTDEEDAIRQANDSVYGLGGSVWTADTDRGMEVAKRLRVGTVGVNHYTFDFIAPLGGYKQSGVGREYGPEGLAQYLEYKSMYPIDQGGAQDGWGAA